MRNTLWVCLTIVIVSIGLIWEADRYGAASYHIGLTNASANEARAKADLTRAQLEMMKTFPPGSAFSFPSPAPAPIPEEDNKL